MDSITLQMLELELGNYKRTDLQKKMDIAVNVFERINESSFTYDAQVSFLDKVSNLTGVNKNVLREVEALEDLSRKFAEWVKEMEVVGGMNNLYATMKKFLQTLYTSEKKIPTKAALTNMFRGRYREEFQAIFNKFFTTIPVPGTHHSMIVEKPEIVLRRHQYLRKKMEFLKAGKTFVYIEDTCFFNKVNTLMMCRPRHNKSRRLLLAVSPDLGYLGSIYDARPMECSFRMWLEQKVIPTLPPGCVFIFEDRLFEDVFDSPQSHSSKQDMIEWLQQHDVPHYPDMHRAELYALVETYKKTYRNITKAEQIINSKGHSALCREEGVVFEYFEPFWVKLKDILTSKRGLTIVPKSSKKEVPLIAKRIISMIQKEYWQELGKKLLDVEINTQKRDRDMEDLIDKLMVFATSDSKQFTPTDSEFDDYCEAVHHEYIFS